MGKLYIVATPIGNLEDITLRALRILKTVDFVAAEDTRVIAKLLNHYAIKKPLVSVHEHSKAEKINSLLEKVQAGNNFAYVTDAGTPGISDPGGFLVSKAIEAGILVVPVPGPSAVTAAVSIAGVPANEFTFLGYFPRKKGRETLLKNLQKEKRPVIFFESPQRILKTLDMMEEFLGSGREIVVCRELTKKFETIYRGKITEIIPQINPKGEFVVIIRGAK